MKRKIAICFMAIGIFFIALAMGLIIFNEYENQKAQESSAVAVESIRLNIAENELKDPIADPFDEEMKIEKIDGYGYIGYLSMPTLGLELPVMSEWDYDRLKIAPCRYYGSTKTDNLVIAAHNYKGHFGSLKKLRIEDAVMFTDMDSKTSYYTVDEIEILMPTDIDKVKDCGNDLILYTCTYDGANRIVVRCSYKKTR